MATNRWVDDRLNRLADEIATNTANITDLARMAESLLEVAEIHQRNIQDLRREVRDLSRLSTLTRASIRFSPRFLK